MTTPFNLALATQLELTSLLQLRPTALWAAIHYGIPTLFVTSALTTVPTDDVVAALELFARRTGQEHVQCFPSSSADALIRKPSTPLFA